MKKQTSVPEPVQSIDAEQKARIAENLLAWYRANKRDLPWRGGSAYAVWVSEIMLQQTQVATVIPFFLRFMERFPSLEALASAPIDDVLQHWAGLGYYARARNLHRAARIVAAEYAGRVPDTPETIEALPGIGRYTAGAILSIAYNVPRPLVDANVIRVLCRVFGIHGDPKSTAVQARLWSLAEQLVPMDRPGDFNQGLMELGALVCRPDDPLCEQCPLLLDCVAGNSPDPTTLPEFPPGRATVSVTHASAIILRDGDSPPAGPETAEHREPAGGGAASDGRSQSGRQANDGIAPSDRRNRPKVDGINSFAVRPAATCPSGTQSLSGELGVLHGVPATGALVLLVQRPPHGLWGGLWEFPRVVCEKGESPEAAAVRAAHETVGLEIIVSERLETVKHGVTHHKITLHGFLARSVPPGRTPRPMACAAVRWVSLNEVDSYALSAPQSLLRAALKQRLTHADPASGQASLPFEE